MQDNELIIPVLHIQEEVFFRISSNSPRVKSEWTERLSSSTHMLGELFCRDGTFEGKDEGNMRTNH